MALHEGGDVHESGKWNMNVHMPCNMRHSDRLQVKTLCFVYPQAEGAGMTSGWTTKPSFTHCCRAAPGGSVLLEAAVWKVMMAGINLFEKWGMLPGDEFCASPQAVLGEDIESDFGMFLYSML